MPRGALRVRVSGYPAPMEGLDHLEHLDKHLVDELTRVAREAVRDELREQARKQRRTAALYGASGAMALYAGAAVALAVGLALAIGLPGWAAALITAAVLGIAAYALREAARPSEPRPAGPSEADLAAGAGHNDRVIGGRAPAAPPSGLGMPYPPVPPVAPSAGAPEAGETGAEPEQPHHRA